MQSDLTVFRTQKPRDFRFRNNSSQMPQDRHHAGLPSLNRTSVIQDQKDVNQRGPSRPQTHRGPRTSGSPQGSEALDRSRGHQCACHHPHEASSLGKSGDRGVCDEAFLKLGLCGFVSIGIRAEKLFLGATPCPMPCVGNAKTGLFEEDDTSSAVGFAPRMFDLSGPEGRDSEGSMWPGHRAFHPHSAQICPCESCLAHAYEAPAISLSAVSFFVCCPVRLAQGVILSDS